MKKLLFSMFLFFLTFNLSASHFVGGEITWTCNNDPFSPDFGKYTFYLHIYQDCDGISFSYTSENITVHNNPAFPGTITCNFSDTNDLSSTGVPEAVPCYNCDNQPNGVFGAI